MNIFHRLKERIELGSSELEKFQQEFFAANAGKFEYAQNFPLPRTRRERVATSERRDKFSPPKIELGGNELENFAANTDKYGDY